MFEDQSQDENIIGKPHGKRIGRELAMAFLFSCEMRNEVPGAQLFENFMSAARQEYSQANSRIIRRAEEYAVKLYTEVALHQEDIDAVLTPLCVNWDWKRLSGVARTIMRVAVAEMLYFEDVPPVVSIDEAVEIARDFSGCEDGNFINGVLNAAKNNLLSAGKTGAK